MLQITILIINNIVLKNISLEKKYIQYILHACI